MHGVYESHAAAIFKKEKKQSILPISDMFASGLEMLKSQARKKLSATMDTETTNLLTYLLCILRHVACGDALYKCTFTYCHYSFNSKLVS